MTIAVGDSAPDFTARDIEGATHHLADLRGSRVWLAFFRYASCPLCNVRVADMIRRHDEWKDHLRVLAVFQSPADSMKRHVGTQQPPFPLLCDPEEALYDLYQLQRSLAGFLSLRNTGGLVKAMRQGFLPGAMEGTKTRLPADFLIDEAGVVREVFYATAIGEHLPISRVDAFAARPEPSPG